MKTKYVASDVRNFETRAGKTIPFTTMGFGSAPLGNYLRALSDSEVNDTLNTVRKNKLKYIDTAPLYGFGLSETRVGHSLSQHPSSRPVISTKVGRILEPCDPKDADGIIFVDIPPVKFIYDYSYDGVMRSFEESLKRLKVDSVDILFVHDVDSFNHGSRDESEARIQELINKGGWKALQELRDSEVVDAIGAGVNEWEPCARLLELVDPDLFLLAGRYTLLEQEPIEKLFPQCQEKGAGIIIGGPFNSGVLAGRTTFNYGEIPQEVHDKVKKLNSVCQEYNVELAQAALHFVLAHPLVMSVIPGAQTATEVQQNVDLIEKEIPLEFWETLKIKNLIHPDSPTPN